MNGCMRFNSRSFLLPNTFRSSVPNMVVYLLPGKDCWARKYTRGREYACGTSRASEAYSYNGHLLDEKPTTWYQSAPGTAKSKLVMSPSIPYCLIAGVGFCILGPTAASQGGSGKARVGRAGASHGGTHRREAGIDTVWVGSWARFGWRRFFVC